jgi:pyrimidine-nucleoside phosphorylase
MDKGIDESEAKHLAEESISSGKALSKFIEFVKAQGGDLSKINVSDSKIEVKAKHDGIIKNIDALGAAKLAAKLGASKMTLDDTIDYSVGIYLKKTKGMEVKKDESLMTLFVKDFNQEFVEEDFDFIEY